VFEPPQKRALLDLAPPPLIDRQPGSDSGISNDENLTNVHPLTIDIAAVQAGGATRVYRAGMLLGDAAQVIGTLCRYTFVAGQSAEGSNSITTRAFDGTEESSDSPASVVALDTLGPRITASTPSPPVKRGRPSLDCLSGRSTSLSCLRRKPGTRTHERRPPSGPSRPRSTAVLGFRQDVGPGRSSICSSSSRIVVLDHSF
jgi:hypothetical protein